MAKSSVVLLGFRDEYVTEKNQDFVNYTTNKIGGQPDWPPGISCAIPSCRLCGLTQLLVLQVYAPLENSPYHRTLYVFACVNPNCWNQIDSWVCLRAQSLEQIEQESRVEATSKPVVSATDWCSDADNWDENIGNEENGNVVNQNAEHVSEDESTSFEDSVKSEFGNLTIDDRNANVGAQGGGAIGHQYPFSLTAEIEGEESEIVTIDTPTLPQRDLISLMNEATPLPPEVRQLGTDIKNATLMQFVAFFISVTEENRDNSFDSALDRRARELLQEYQQNNDDVFKLKENNIHSDFGGVETYEKNIPIHGNKLSHNFVSKIQRNPGQIMRYSREGQPLLLHPLQGFSQKCRHCHSELVFELQILPTIIPELRLCIDKVCTPRVDFGTVVVFTCRNNCWSANSSVREEAVYVQFE